MPSLFSVETFLELAEEIMEDYFRLYFKLDFFDLSIFAFLSLDNLLLFSSI
jgi:ABC-type long-subunit fatty acid transport system fused permease/ATPase subunit